MKFYTIEVYQARALGKYEGLHKAREDYREHLSQMQGVIPARVLEIADLPLVQDALVMRVGRDLNRNELTLVLRCGTSTHGYYDLVLIYEDVEISPADDVAIAKAARSTKSQCYFGCNLNHHELDIAEEDQIEHRFEFHASEWFHPTEGGRIEFAIRCRALRWRRIPRRTRRFNAVVDRYPGGPSL